MRKFAHSTAVLLSLGFALTACQKPDNSSVQLKALKPLPQDKSIVVYTNHNPANRFTDRYRQQTRFGDDLEQIIIDAINSATSSIDIAVQELRLPGIAQTLQKQHRQGIRIRVILENSYRKAHSKFSAAELAAIPDRSRNRIIEGRRLIDRNNNGQLSPTEAAQNDALVILEQANIPLIDDTADGSKGSGLMHHKFVVIDGQRTIVTSANFTMSDMVGDFASEHSRGNPNTLLDITSPKLAAIFLEEFNLLWGDGPGGQTDSKFGTKKPHRSAKTITIDNTIVKIQFSPAKAKIPWAETTNGLIAKQLQTAKQSIDLALFVFSDQQLVNAMEPLHKNGIKTRALIDSGFIYRPYSEALDMLGVTLASKACKLEPGNAPWQQPMKLVGTPRLAPGDLLHHKFGIIDQHTVIIGSQNWTEAANRGNDEFALTIVNPTVAAHYQREFDRLAEGAYFGLPPAIQKKVKAQNCAIQTPLKTTNGKVNLNTATIVELDTLPGIGQKTAKRIIQHRPFASITDLDNVPGIGPKTLRKLEPHVTW
ncbi:helix-hairpin-helix domain-containing protein [filamentous cyanobacterium LEGE 11480]|uniref:phospholipase D n=1 Tax=Romeriopsis navalis LEGE 11480 TaxID=2777977 RepID=A0A928Z644_9CYAN|nr:phospholipase D-like domain-containing protein [Romeriopsis navalis]MBE9032657.1 helix-hairpin-helix domain-containing protein [Romeriopsis navalis LEGE 11480]